MRRPRQTAFRVSDIDANEGHTDQLTSFVCVPRVFFEHKADVLKLRAKMNKELNQIEYEQTPASTMAADEPQPVKMGRPRKSDCEKWRTRLMRVLADAHDEVAVYIEVNGNNIEILF
ncbi:hypothetical protein [Ruegeria arenilitoris]|uniref:hypothetical protein n=1 Tax=Ruegeria arenilitoris TaxID=1173585 RepID=UPI00147A735A|nr:hypothetical protein [Ruegeria arenilitoris]